MIREVELLFITYYCLIYNQIPHSIGTKTISQLYNRTTHNYSIVNAFLSSYHQENTTNVKIIYKTTLARFVTHAITIVCCLCGFSSLYGQHPGFEMNYPGPHAESAYSIAATNDGGFVMTGFQGINIGQSNIALRKVNAEGEELWVNYLGNGGSNLGFSIIENAWGNLVVAGRTNETTPPPDHHEAYLAELDQNGEIIWERTFPHSAGTGFLNVVKPTSDMGYVVAGGQVNLIGESSSTDVFVAKTDAMGDTLWTFAWGTIQLDLINDIFIQPDGSILCAGVTRDFLGFQEMLLLKLNNAGQLLWLNTYDIEGHEAARSIAVDSQNNIILGGHSDYVDTNIYLLPNICIVKTDSTGNLIWYKKYGGDKDDNVKDIILDEENNIYAVGNSSSYKPPGSPTTGYAGFLKKLNSEGDSLWTRVFYENSTNFSNIQYSPTGGFMICGGTNARMYLVRTDEWGCVEEGCELNTSVGEFETESYLLLSAWPNPTDGQFQLSSNVSLNEEHHLLMLDVNGRILHKWKNPLKYTASKQFDVSSFSNGVYILKLVMDSGERGGAVFRLLKN